MKKSLLLIFIVIFSSCNISKEYYESGIVKTKGKISNGQKTGHWKYYFENGNYQGGGKYLEGKRTGTWKWYHNNGELEQIGEYLNDEQTGEWLFYHDNTNLAGIGTLDDGKLVGIWKWYHTNGAIHTEREWKSGKFFNVISCYDGKGNKLDKGSLLNGNGTVNLYDIDGKLIETWNYVNGEMK